MAEEDRATASSIKIPTWDGTEGEKAQMHVTKLESAAELGGYAEALEMSFESANHQVKRRLFKLMMKRKLQS